MSFIIGEIRFNKMLKRNASATNKVEEVINGSCFLLLMIGILAVRIVGLAS